mmetsp:Transcript_11490/g.20875  ORF Transcript_11490/g.20875 Transcript_11490/m.20875 type:complete len:201 (-) Transcript_11490:1401-2003(-)
MCSVRHKPIPRAPSSDALAASGPESAFAITVQESATLSAHSRTVPISPSIDGVLVSIPIRITSPVFPLREITSPSLNTSPVLLMVAVFASSSISSSPQPQTQGFPQPRATTAACDVMPPRAVRTPSAAHIPPTSSGDVFSRTRITFSPSALRSSAVLASKTIFPTAAPGPPARPVATTLSLYVDEARASGVNAGCSNCLM